MLRLVRSNGLPSPAANAFVEHHHDRHAFERDRERDAALTAAGWRVVRFTHRQVASRPDRIAQTLRRLGLS